MGIQERKERHKEDFKQKILSAAKLLFMKYGYEATSIRKIAAEIEFSPTTIYLYYKDKSDIMYALHQEGFKLLGQQFYALEQVEHPFERLKAMGRVYIRFALEHPDFYELMFIMEDPLKFLNAKCETKFEEWEEGVQAFDYLLNTISECQKVGYFASQDTKTMSLITWSTVHGLCSLSIHGHLDYMATGHDLFESGEIALNASYASFVTILEKIA